MSVRKKIKKEKKKKLHPSKFSRIIKVFSA